MCDNCPGTVWFDHKAKIWRHTEGKAMCAKPFPYFPDGRDRSYIEAAREAQRNWSHSATTQESRPQVRRVKKRRSTGAVAC